MSTNIPIIRKKPEGGEDFLLSLHVAHPAGPEGPQFEFKWDGNWVQAQGLPPVFAQQVFLSAFQAMLSAFLIICGNVVPPMPPGTPQN
jgi:hypothetical protein